MNAFLLLIASLPAFAATDCINIVPGKSLGPLRLGEPPPSKIEGMAAAKNSSFAGWHKLGPYEFQVNAEGKIESIQHLINHQEACYSLNGSRFRGFKNSKAMKKAFPRCRYSEDFGPTALVCDGLVWIGGPNLDFPKTLVAMVEAKTLRQREEEKAAEHVRSILKQEWPNRGGPKK